ncbi:MAG: hypothetical protein J3K34DRAFT_21293 [Monoraphidium minutum]|nr:MAG: hypothetical protein J3K34DRAFT_21293 [Monoraphidium minutum]
MDPPSAQAPPHPPAAPPRGHRSDAFSRRAQLRTARHAHPPRRLPRRAGRPGPRAPTALSGAPPPACAFASRRPHDSFLCAPVPHPHRARRRAAAAAAPPRPGPAPLKPRLLRCSAPEPPTNLAPPAPARRPWRPPARLLHRAWRPAVAVDANYYH